MRRVAGPQDDDRNADIHERWNKCSDLAMLVVFLVAVVAAAADAHLAAIGAALVAAVTAAATAFAATRRLEYVRSVDKQPSKDMQ